MVDIKEQNNSKVLTRTYSSPSIFSINYNFGSHIWKTMFFPRFLARATFQSISTFISENVLYKISIPLTFSTPLFSGKLITFKLKVVPKRSLSFFYIYVIFIYFIYYLHPKYNTIILLIMEINLRKFWYR